MADGKSTVKKKKKNRMHCIFFPWDENEFSEKHLRLNVICTIPCSKVLLVGNKSLIVILLLLEFPCPMSLLSHLKQELQWSLRGREG